VQAAASLPSGRPEPILRRDDREISLLAARENLSLSYARRAAGEQVTEPHLHEHTEGF
jgi:hypothetical protein